MNDLRPIAVALAAVGFAAAPTAASATSTPLTDLCAGAPVTDTFYSCSPGVITLTAACVIKVPANQNFHLQDCNVAAAGYPVTIKGSGTTRIDFFNGTLTDAAKFEVQAGNGAGNDCGDAIQMNWRVEANKVDLKANGGVLVYTNSAYYVPKGGIVAETVAIKSKWGDVCVRLGYPGSTDGIQAEKTEVKSEFGATSVTP